MVRSEVASKAVLRIGEVAAQAGVNVQTLRYYERRGLLEEPGRRSSGYREYPAVTVQAVRFIKRAQELGFTLKEIEELLHLQAAHGQSCVEAAAAAQAKIQDIDKKIRSLKAIKSLLEELVAGCATVDRALGCSVLSSGLAPERREIPESPPEARSAPGGARARRGIGSTEGVGAAGDRGARRAGHAGAGRTA